MGSVFAQEMTIDEFLEAYEEFVLAVEGEAEECDGSNYIDILNEYAEFTEFCQEIDDSNWSEDELLIFQELTERYTIAMAELANYASYEDLMAVYEAYGY